MAHRIVWSNRAAQDLDSITDYIAAESDEDTTRFPQAGRKVPEFDDENVRELVVYSYRIIYRLQQAEALIVAGVPLERAPGTVPLPTVALEHEALIGGDCAITVAGQHVLIATLGRV